MNATTLNKKDIVKTFSNILGSLSKKEKSIIERRIWLKWHKETLQSIWDSLVPSVTRERVRQIEESGIRKIWRIIKTSKLFPIQEKASELINLHWGLISKNKLINNIIKDLSIESDINTSIIETVVQSDFDLYKSKQKLGCKIYFYSPKINTSFVWLIHKEALKILKRRKDIIEKIKLYESIQENLKEKWDISITFIDSVLDLFDDIVYWEENLVWLASWKILNPKTLKDKAKYVLKKENIPMHFVDIWNKITEFLWETAKVTTIHNELIRSDDFVLIWRWIYALKEWWFKSGTVIDVIIEVLKKKWEPMNTEEITKKVLKVRDVKTSTVYMNLQNKDIIERVGRNYYDLKK